MKIESCSLLFVLICSLAISACNSTKSEKLAVLSERSVQDTSFTARQQIESKRKLEALYDEKLSVDTVFVLDSDSLAVHFEFFCPKETELTIPADYYELGGDFKAYDFVSRFQLSNENQVLNNELIEKSTFDSLLSEELRKYGILMSPSIKVSDDGSFVRIHYSITIPGTDIGTSTSIYFDHFGGRHIDQY